MLWSNALLDCQENESGNCKQPVRDDLIRNTTVSTLKTFGRRLRQGVVYPVKGLHTSCAETTGTKKTSSPQKATESSLCFGPRSTGGFSSGAKNIDSVE